MKVISITLIVTLAAVTAFAAPARADLYEVYRITSSAGDNVAGQLFVDVTWDSVLGMARFHFTNSGLLDDTASITRLYFDDGSLLDLASIDESAGVDFSEDVGPGDLPGGNLLDPDFNVTHSFQTGALPPTYHNGVNDPDEYVDILFTLQDGQTIEDVYQELNDTTLRIGLHVQGIGGGVNDWSDSFVTLIPAPGAALLGIVGLGLVGWVRRRIA